MKFQLGDCNDGNVVNTLGGKGWGKESDLNWKLSGKAVGKFEMTRKVNHRMGKDFYS